MGSARADCLVALPDGISNAFARGQLDWVEIPLEQAAEREFEGQT
jgi:hypothetical protein